MIHARPPRGRPNPRVTLRLPDLALDERESAYFAPRMGDWVLLGLLVVVLLGNGLVMWHQLGPANDHTGRAIFFGLALLCALWFALVYTFKLSVSVRIGPHGVGVVRGPWRTELAWSQVARLVERVQVESGQRFRWVVVFAQDGRSMQVREDMVIDYPRFRQEVWERFRLWRDHGGTWGATGGGAFSARESSSTETLWWLVAGCAALLPGLYFALVLPELGLLGPPGCAARRIPSMRRPSSRSSSLAGSAWRGAMWRAWIVAATSSQVSCGLVSAWAGSPSSWRRAPTAACRASTGRRVCPNI